MTATLFLAYLVIVASVVMVVIKRWLPRRFPRVAVGLLIWLLYVGILSYTGIVGDATRRPPGAVFVVLPVVALTLYLAASSAGGQLAMALPVWVLLGIQCFRIGVELLIHRLWTDGLVPKLMTFEGGNVDIYIGLSALVIAWISTKGRPGLWIALAWNVVGLGALSNILVRALGTTPGALHIIASEVPDVAIGMFPFTFLAGFFAPLALIVHVLAIRAVWSRLHAGAVQGEVGTRPMR